MQLQTFDSILMISISCYSVCLRNSQMLQKLVVGSLGSLGFNLHFRRGPWCGCWFTHVLSTPTCRTAAGPRGTVAKTCKNPREIVWNVILIMIFVPWNGWECPFDILWLFGCWVQFCMFKGILHGRTWHSKVPASTLWRSILSKGRMEKSVHIKMNGEAWMQSPMAFYRKPVIPNRSNRLLVFIGYWQVFLIASDSIAYDNHSSADSKFHVSQADEGDTSLETCDRLEPVWRVSKILKAFPINMIYHLIIYI